MLNTNPDSIQSLFNYFSKANNCMIFSDYDPSSLTVKLYMKKNGKETERKISSLDSEDDILIGVLNEMYEELIKDSKGD